MPPRFETETIGFLITDVARLMRAEFDRRTAETGFGLTPGEARTLIGVARAGPIRQTALAERMGVEAMTLSAFLDRLERHGLITRTIDTTDRRAKLVEVTDAAGPMIDDIVRIGAGITADLGQQLSRSELDELRSTLSRVRATLVAIKPSCAKPPVSA